MTNYYLYNIISIVLKSSFPTTEVIMTKRLVPAVVEKLHEGCISCSAKPKEKQARIVCFDGFRRLARKWYNIEIKIKEERFCAPKNGDIIYLLFDEGLWTGYWTNSYQYEPFREEIEAREFAVNEPLILKQFEALARQ